MKPLRIVDGPGLQCLTCLDVTSDSQLAMIEDMLRSDIHKGYNAASCANSMLRTCSPGQICVISGLNISGSCRPKMFFTALICIALAFSKCTAYIDRYLLTTVSLCRLMRH